MPVASGRDLIERIGVAEIGTAFDVIVTDILMPDVDGISRSHLYLRWAYAPGAQYTLSKPFLISDLFDAVNDNARGRRDH